MSNALGAPAGLQPMASPPAGAPASTSPLETAKAQFQQLAKTRKLLDAVKNELGSLAKLGDTVSAEDVIKGAGNLVAAGADPHQLAALMADMPSDSGAGLAGWVAMHAQQSGEMEQKLDQALEVARHHMAVMALHGIVAGGAGPQGGAPPPASPSASASPSSNALAPAGA